MNFLLPLILGILAVIPAIIGIVLTIKKNENGIFISILSMILFTIFISSLIIHTVEKDDLNYIQKARLHAEYLESGIVHDLADYSEFCDQVIKANNRILEAREKKDNVWVGYAYYESVANQELITVNFYRNE